MGRRIGRDLASRTISFSLKPNDFVEIEYRVSKTKVPITTGELMDKLNEIAERERIPRSELIKRAVTSYVGLHFEGNYQTLIDNHLVDQAPSDSMVAEKVYQSFKHYKAVKLQTIMEALTEIKKPLERTKHGKSIYQRIQKGGKT